MTLNRLRKQFEELSITREKGKAEEYDKGYKQLPPVAKSYLFSQIPQMTGVSYRMLEKPKEALPFALMTVKWATKAKDIKQEANARRDLGGIYTDLEKFKEAENEYQKSLKLIWGVSEGKINSVSGTLSFLARLLAKRKRKLVPNRNTLSCYSLLS